MRMLFNVVSVRRRNSSQESSAAEELTRSSKSLHIRAGLVRKDIPQPNTRFTVPWIEATR